MSRIRVVAFASAGDILGAPEVTIELAPGSRLSDLTDALTTRYPPLADSWSRLAVAVDGTLIRGEDPILADDAEVALLPPVSGGGPLADSAVAVGQGRVALVEHAIDVDAVCRAVAGDGRGATVLFLGTVRNHHAGRSVAKLTYSGYVAMAETALRRIVDELEAGAPHLRAAIVHRLGEVPLGAPSVAIATASPHRAAAYEANRRALERLKREVPIWKREHYADGKAVWREEESLAE